MDNLFQVAEFIGEAILGAIGIASVVVIGVVIHVFIGG